MWLGTASLFLLAAPASAASFDVGTISLQYDFGGLYYFIQVDNWTGDPALDGYAMPPEFPVMTGLKFENIQITYVTVDPDGEESSVTEYLDSMFPGTSDPPQLLYLDGSLVFRRILFSAAIYPGTMTIDGVAYTAADLGASAHLEHTDGTPLDAFDVANIGISADSESAVPEPATALLLAGPAVIGLLVLKRRRS